MDDCRKTKTQLLQEIDSLRQQLAERKQTEETLQASEGRWRLFVTHAPVAIAMFDRQMRYLAVSGRWQTEFGVNTQELIGRSHYEVFPNLSEDWKVIYQRALAGSVEHREGQFVQPNGTVQWQRWEVQPWLEPSGAIGGVILFTEDITERKRMEEQVQRSASWLGSLIDATQDAVISIDRQARIVLFNPAAEFIFGYAKAEIIGQKVNILMAEPYASEHDSYIARYEATGMPQAIGRIRTVTARRKNGQLFPLELSVTEIARDDDIHYAAFIRDISERVRLQEQLLDRERLAAIGTTAAKLAHEVGNPLNGMALSVQLLERRLASSASDEKIMERVRGLRQQIVRLTQLLNEFRSLSRRQQYDLHPTNLAVVVATVLDSEAVYYRSRGVRVEHHFPDDFPQVRVDSSKLTQVLVNLFKNAVEAMPAGGTLTVRGAHSGGKVTLEVSDTGTGIPEGVDIFQPFITTKPEGSGLGLPIVRQIIAGHGGSLAYRSEPGKGTTFVISLPVSSAVH